MLAMAVPPPVTERTKLLFLILGGLVTLAGFSVSASAVALGVAFVTQRDAGGYFTTPVERYHTSTYALVSKSLALATQLGPGDWAVREGPPVQLHVQATSGRSDVSVFIGIARTQDVRAYLSGVAYDEVARVEAEPSKVEYRTQSGVATPARPAAQSMWSASASGVGTRTIDWNARPGQWTLVAMNADGSPGVNVDLQVSMKADWLGAFAQRLAVGGFFTLVIGVAAVIFGGFLPPETPRLPVPSAEPITLEASLDTPLGRWLWLVKWLLAIPHFVVLLFLLVAFVVLTVVAFFAILFTERYPMALFETNVGILRWGWRVGYYAYSTLGTDRYPPFTLQQAEYPATFTVAYPERLSRGLALVKWWLLAIPHYIIVGVFVASGPGRAGLVTILVFFAAIALLFSGRYPQGIFDLAVGLNRWIYRVIAYAALMRDEYPPFRLDLGGKSGQD
ncbi:DUF4389 domain-containing protein [bacterium]|nr:MAG: DUF4389 domain-containing protein [bacterium]